MKADKKGVQLPSAAKFLVSKLRGSGIRRDYELEESATIGKGRYGEVLRGWKKDTQEEVAVKKLTKVGKKAAAIEKMRQEIEIMKRAKHSHCVKLHAVYESANHIYIVMEMLKGGELLKRIIEKDCYSEREAAHVFGQIVSAVTYLHSIGVVHRDLKPDNIMFVSDSEDASVKICDYGLSKLVEPSSLSSGRARLFSRCGTPNFVAPEIFEGRAYGSEVDVWSAGVMLYVLLCGFLPFEQKECEVEGEESVLVPQIGKLDFPAPHWKHVSKEARHLVSQMLQLHPEDRPTMAEVAGHAWLGKLRRGELPAEPLPQMQRRLKELRARKLMGAVHSLTALRRMRSDRNWEQVHQVYREEAARRLSAVQAEAGREAELRESFDLLDRDKSGRISVENLADSMAALGVQMEQRELQEMLTRFDLYKTGDICFRTFCIMMAGPVDAASAPPSIPSSECEHDSDSDGAHATPGRTSGETLDEELEEELRQTFDALDVDRSGFIDSANLREVLARFGTQLSEEEAAEILKTGDLKGTGVIDFEEFFALMCRPIAGGSEALMQPRNTCGSGVA